MIAWRVDELAAQRGWNARKLSQVSGLDEKTVRTILTGRATRVDLKTIERLATALNVGPGSLWSVTNDPREAWERTAGAAGRASPDELERAVAPGVSIETDPGLERARRDL